VFVGVRAKNLKYTQSIRGGLATGRASRGRICRLVRARQFWREKESCRNLEESKGIWSNSVEIQEFLSRRNSCKKILLKWLKTGIFKTPPKPGSCERIPPKKNGKKILRNPVFFCFSVQKNKFLSNRNYQPR
jgi:hypothetical protein